MRTNKYPLSLLGGGSRFSENAAKSTPSPPTTTSDTDIEGALRAFTANLEAEATTGTSSVSEGRDSDSQTTVDQLSKDTITTSFDSVHLILRGIESQLNSVELPESMQDFASEIRDQKDVFDRATKDQASEILQTFFSKQKESSSINNVIAFRNACRLLDFPTAHFVRRFPRTQSQESRVASGSRISATEATYLENEPNAGRRALLTARSHSQMSPSGKSISLEEATFEVDHRDRLNTHLNGLKSCSLGHRTRENLLSRLKEDLEAQKFFQRLERRTPSVKTDVERYRAGGNHDEAEMWGSYKHALDELDIVLGEPNLPEKYRMSLINSAVNFYNSTAATRRPTLQSLQENINRFNRLKDEDVEEDENDGKPGPSNVTPDSTPSKPSIESINQRWKESLKISSESSQVPKGGRSSPSSADSPREDPLQQRSRKSVHFKGEDRVVSFLSTEPVSLLEVQQGPPETFNM